MRQTAQTLRQSQALLRRNSNEAAKDGRTIAALQDALAKLQKALREAHAPPPPPLAPTRGTDAASGQSERERESARARGGALGVIADMLSLANSNNNNTGGCKPLLASAMSQRSQGGGAAAAGGCPVLASAMSQRSQGGAGGSVQPVLASAISSNRFFFVCEG